MNHKSKRLIIVFALFVMVVYGQNCSRVDYAGASSIEKPMGEPSDDGDLGVPVPTASPSPGPSASPSPSPAPDDSDVEFAACNELDIRDLVLNVKAIYVNQKTEIAPLSKTIHLSDLLNGVPISFPRKMAVSNLRIVLEKTGNEIIEPEGSKRELVLRTPSQQQSGLKVSIDGPAVQVEPGKIYKLRGFDASVQLQSKPWGCKVQPVWKSATLE